jgi:hypothetical protein
MWAPLPATYHLPACGFLPVKRTKLETGKSKTCLPKRSVARAFGPHGICRQAALERRRPRRRQVANPKSLVAATTEGGAVAMGASEGLRGNQGGAELFVMERRIFVLSGRRDGA